MRKPLVLLAAVVVLASAILSAQQAPPPTFSGVIVLENYLESLRQQAEIPGMSGAIVKDGEIAWEKGFGYQNLAARVRATPATPYLVGDLSQTLAAVLTLQCVEQRRLELDRPIQAYGLTDPEPSATLRRLLSHANPDIDGPAFLYSPDRYAHLAQLVEWCVPQPYRKSVSHRLLNRLAMIDSAPGTDWLDPDLALPEGLYEDDQIQHYRDIVARMAVPYRVDAKGRAQRTELAPMSMTATNGLVSTVRDLAQLDRALDTSLLLLDDTRELAWTPVQGRDGDPTPAGLGWFVQYYRGERVVWHFGYMPNAYSSLIVKLPSRHLTFILLANSDGLSAPFQLSEGDVTRSLFATLFLRLAI
jgi:CubicO group peptidase (beta-lactamase class C family)